MTFEKALEILKNGGSVHRMGWNGKNMYVFKVPEKMVEGTFGPYKRRAYLAMCTADGEIVPWVASQSDLLENDWARDAHIVSNVEEVA